MPIEHLLGFYVYSVVFCLILSLSNVPTNLKKSNEFAYLYGELFYEDKYLLTTWFSFPKSQSVA